MLGKNDIIIIESTGEREVSAEYFTMQFWKTKNYKFKDAVSQKSEMQKLKIEYLAEFSFMEFLCRELSARFDGKELDWSINKAELTDRYILLVGINDAKTQKTVREKTIDLKTHYDKKVTIEEILGLEPYKEPYTMLLERLNYPKTDIIVQAYILTNNSIALAGYQKGFLLQPGSTPEFYTKKNVTELFKMKDLISEF